ncbi:MAG: C25 family cysteine peptidase [Bacteroidota bacterium]|nr:C25 family cysteine peptidase [Bacteroidota bacterium]
MRSSNYNTGISLKLCLFFICLQVFNTHFLNSQNVISIITNEDGFIIDFTLPSYQVTDTNIYEAYGINHDYSFIEVEYFGEMVDTGYPNLPHYTFDLHLPDDATVFSVSVSDKQTSTLQLTNKILPAQEVGEDDTLSFAFNSNYYLSDGGLYAFDYQISDTFDIMGASGISFSIFPFHYNPGADSLEVTENCLFTITHNGSSSLLLKPDSANSPVKNQYLSKVFENYPTPKNVPVDKGKYLIITDPLFESTLLYFANYKRNIGYDVTVVNTTTTGTTNTDIKSYIQTRYNNSNTRPDFVLLVGDQTYIPASGGSTSSSYNESDLDDDYEDPLTDLNYTRLSGSDYFADVFLGRFSIETNSELQNIIYKTIYMETNLHAINKRADLLAGGGDGENQFDNPHRWVMDNVLNPQGFDYYFHFAIDGATRTDGLNALDADNTLFIYRGHGGYNIIGSPFNLVENDINNSINTIFPFGFSFSCLTNCFGYASGKCFGEAWTCNNHGGISFFGATTITRRHTNNVIEEKVFDYMDDKDQLSPFINLGMKKYYRRMWSWFSGKRRKRHMKTYNLLGDPSIYLYGIGCQDDYIFTNNEEFHSGDKITYHATYDIVTDEGNTTFIAQSGSEVNLIAGNSITLKPGFSAENGCLFSASIAPCITPATLKALNNNVGADFISINNEFEYSFKNVVTCYPNPANEMICFYFNIGEKELNSIAIYDILGNKRIELPLKNSSVNNWQKLEIDISFLPEGSYLYLINFSNGHEKGKFVKVY